MDNRSQPFPMPAPTRVRTLAAVAATFLVSCSSPAARDAEDVGVARIALAAVPSDAQCLQISAQGTRTVSRRFSLVPNTDATIELGGLPLGDVQFGAIALAARCEANGSVEPSWVSDPVSVNILKGEVAQVTLVMHRNGRASISVDFCDADIQTDVANCGLCDHVCPAGPASRATCVQGICGLECDPQRSNCDQDAANGCEVDLASDAAHCGACDNPCSSGSHSQPTCAAGACGLACAVGFANCDQDATNGCEVSLNTSASHCGACDNVCAAGQACRSGVCTTVAAAAVGTIAASSLHTCAVVNGGLRCWGYNKAGQLGTGTLVDSLYPIQVTGLTSGVTAVAAGNEHTCAIVAGGVRCWGGNTYGQLGNGGTTKSLVPVQVAGLTAGVTAIAATNYHTCAVVDGSVVCWGWNGTGQLGNNSTESSSVPVRVQGLTSGATAIAVGGGNFPFSSSDRSCAIVNGGLQCWGVSEFWVRGGSTSPVPVSIVGLTSGVSNVAIGEWHTCAIVDGDAQCWGLADFTTMTPSSVPGPVPGLGSDVTEIAAGLDLTCAIIGGGVECLGQNTWGELGDGTTTAWAAMPVPVQGLRSGVTAIAIGPSVANHVCATVNDRLECWGRNIYGELGNGTTQDSNVPVPVSEPLPPPPPPPPPPPCECVVGSERCDQYMHPNFCILLGDGCGHWAPVGPPAVDGCGGVYPYSFPEGPVCQGFNSSAICYADSAGCRVAGVCPGGQLCSGYPRVGPGKCLPICSSPTQTDCVRI